MRSRRQVPVLALFLTFFFGPNRPFVREGGTALVLIVVAATGYYTLGITAVVAWIVRSSGLAPKPPQTPRV